MPIHTFPVILKWEHSHFLVRYWTTSSVNYQLLIQFLLLQLLYGDKGFERFCMLELFIQTTFIHLRFFAYYIKHLLSWYHIFNFIANCMATVTLPSRKVKAGMTYVKCQVITVCLCLLQDFIKFSASTDIICKCFINTFMPEVGQVACWCIMSPMKVVISCSSSRKPCNQFTNYFILGYGRVM